MFRNNFTLEPKVRSSCVITNKQTNYSPQSHKFSNSLQRLSVTIQSNHIFQQSKLLSLIKTFQWTQRCAQLKQVIQRKPEPHRASAVWCKALCNAGSLSARQTPNPAPRANNNLRQLPRTVGLERSSHGVTQPKMLTKFHSPPWEQRETSTHSLPIKISKPTHNILIPHPIDNYKT